MGYATQKTSEDNDSAYKGARDDSSRGGHALDDLRPASELLVECIRCGVSMPWSLLSLGDGICTKCLTASAIIPERIDTCCGTSSHQTCNHDALVVHPEATSSARWQRRNRSDQ